MQTNSVVMMQEAKPPSDSCITAGNDRNSWFSLILSTTPKTLLQGWIWACLIGGLFNTSGIRSLSFLHPASRNTPLWHRLRLPALPQDSLESDPAAWDQHGATKHPSWNLSIWPFASPRCRCRRLSALIAAISKSEGLCQAQEYWCSFSSLLVQMI